MIIPNVVLRVKLLSPKFLPIEFVQPSWMVLFHKILEFFIEYLFIFKRSCCRNGAVLFDIVVFARTLEIVHLTEIIEDDLLADIDTFPSIEK